MDPAALENLLRHIASQHQAFFYLLWGTTAEQQLAEKLHLKFSHSCVLPRLPLSVLQNFMDQMDHVLAMDSLPLHLAGTTQTSTFSVFGASALAKYKPEGEKHRGLQGNCPYGKTFEKRCPILRTCATGACIQKLTGEEVFRTLNEQL
jgi:heptosyltransferase-1